MSERVLILGDDLQVFLAVARSLGRRGLEVHAAPWNADAPALQSRFVTACHRLPLYADGAEAWEAALRRLMNEQAFRLVIPTSDNSLSMLSHHADTLGRERLAIANPVALAAFTDKGATRALAEALGVPMAKGLQLLGDESADHLLERLGLPLVLKPRTSYRLGSRVAKRYASIARTRTEVAEALATGAWQEGIAESFFEGVGVGLSVLARKGRILQTYQHRRLQESSDTGPSTRRISEPVDPALLALVEKLVSAVALDGVAMFEFRRDRKTGEHILLEVNPRFWGSLPLALAAGADFPAQYYEVSVGGAEPALRSYRAGVRKTDLTEEYHRLAATVHGARGWAQRFLAMALMAAAAPTLMSHSGFDSWARDDRAPYRAERRELARIAAAAAAKRLRLRRPRTSGPSQREGWGPA